ncbi:MAG: hypothetical protein JOZ74_09275 [Bradyrhizobium sp.]|nr:hypothetical protein [Bradyrhizobium sp.]
MVILDLPSIGTPLFTGRTRRLTAGSIGKHRQARELIGKSGSEHMSRLQEKVQARTKQAIGQMIGDDKLIVEGKEQERHAEEPQQGADQRTAADRSDTTE